MAEGQKTKFCRDAAQLAESHAAEAITDDWISVIRAKWHNR